MYQKKPPISWSSEDDEIEEQQPFRTRIRRKGVGIIDFVAYEDHTDVYCPHCKAAGFEVKLGPKILMPGETRQPDYESWLQCPDCFEVIAAYVVEHDATMIRDDIPTVDNPFQDTTEIISAHPKRTSVKGKQALAKRRKERDRQHHKDPEIDREIQQYGSDNVHVVFDSDP